MCLSIYNVSASLQPFKVPKKALFRALVRARFVTYQIISGLLDARHLRRQWPRPGLAEMQVAVWMQGLLHELSCETKIFLHVRSQIKIQMVAARLVIKGAYQTVRLDLTLVQLR